MAKTDGANEGVEGAPSVARRGSVGAAAAAAAAAGAWPLPTGLFAAATAAEGVRKTAEAAAAGVPGALTAPVTGERGADAAAGVFATPAAADGGRGAAGPGTVPAVVPAAEAAAPFPPVAARMKRVSRTDVPSLEEAAAKAAAGDLSGLRPRAPDPTRPDAVLLPSSDRLMSSACHGASLGKGSAPGAGLDWNALHANLVSAAPVGPRATLGLRAAGVCVAGGLARAEPAPRSPSLW